MFLVRKQFNFHSKLHETIKIDITTRFGIKNLNKIDQIVINYTGKYYLHKKSNIYNTAERHVKFYRTPNLAIFQ